MFLKKSLYYSVFEEKLNRCVRLFDLMKDNYDARFLPLSAAVPGGDSVMGCLANLSGKLGELREEFMSYGFGVNSSDVYPASASASAVGSSFGGSGGGGAAGDIPMAVIAYDSNLPVEAYAVAVADHVVGADLPVAVALGASVATNPQGIFGGASVATQVASASHQASGSR